MLAALVETGLARREVALALVLGVTVPLGYLLSQRVFARSAQRR